MNAIVEFVFSPILSLFSPSFYRQILKSSLARGLFYLLYLSLIATIFFFIFFQSKVMPVFNEFAGWLSREVPEIHFQDGVVSSSVPQPFELKHQKFGMVMILDTSKDGLKPEEMTESMIYVTRSFIYARNPVRNEIRAFDLAAMQAKNAGKSGRAISGVLNGEVITEMVNKARPFIQISVFFLVFLFFYAWKLGVAIFYSSIALVLNLFREERFSYASLLNLSSFAITAVSLIQILSLVIDHPLLYLQFWMAVLITTVYIGFGLFVASSPDKTISPSEL